MVNNGKLEPRTLGLCFIFLVPQELGKREKRRLGEAFR